MEERPPITLLLPFPRFYGTLDIRPGKRGGTHGVNREEQRQRREKAGAEI